MIRVIFLVALLGVPSLAHAECTGPVTSTTINTITVRLPRACKPLKGAVVTVAPSGFVAVAASASLTAGLAAAVSAAQSVPTTLLLAHDGRWSVNLVLPATPFPITIMTEASARPMTGVRVTPQAEGTIPRLVPAQLGSPTIVIQGGGYTLRGLQIDSPGVGVTTVDLDSATLPKNVTLDQVLIRGNPITGGHRGVAANGVNVSIMNSWIDRMWEVGRDSQAVAIWDAPGPLRVENTYLEASGENFLLGGAVPTCGCVPTDVTFTRNTVAKDAAWRTMDPQPQVKNLLEVKYGRRVTIDGNTFQFNWQQAQTGWSILFTTQGIEGTPWTIIEDVTFTHNHVSDVANGVNIAAVGGPVHRAMIADNVWDRIDMAMWGGDGRFGLVQTGRAGVEDLSLVHNTVRGVTGNMFLGLYGDIPLQRFTMTHMIVEHLDYGIHSTAGLAIDALKAMAPGAVFRDNAIIGAPADWLKWPEGNFTVDLPLADQFEGDALKANSPLALLPTSDGLKVGAR